MYSKYKDANPTETIERIKQIFHRVGVHLDCITEKHVEGIYTSYLTDSACHWRTEGKGTTAEFCEASAYGEAMEHICTHYAFDISTVSQKAKMYRGFSRYPDEEEYPVEEIENVAPVILEEMEEPFCRLNRRIPEKEEILSLWKKILKSDVTSFVPFYHVNEDKTVLLPDAVLAKLCGTNGGASGNTPEEAIGHALDEIVERWCKYEIYINHLTPPEVPDSYLKERCPELYQLKADIETKGKFRILVLDSSLGKGYPVVGIVIIDPEKSRYLVNFGCHPLFEIALERCFTEIFQDRKTVPELIERRDMAVWADFNPEDIMCQRNWAKLLEDDLGLWPDEFFAPTPSWEFVRWPEYENYSNRIGVKVQLDNLLRDGADVYIRNVGFLGFPVYKVYIKGKSISHINYTEEIMDEFSMVERIRPFLRGEMDPGEKEHFAKKVFGRGGIMGRMFFYTLSNEEFALLHSSFLWEHGQREKAYEMIRPWNDRESIAVKRVMELAENNSTQNALQMVRRFTTESVHQFLEAFFGEHSFENVLDYYGYSADSRQSMSGERIQPARDAYMVRVKDYMSEHKVKQDDIRSIVR